MARNTSLSSPHAYAIGYADASDLAVSADHFTPGTVVIEPALVDDANLDGRVNFTDFQLLAASFNGNNTSWDQGNFNYGAKTNFTDFQLLAANFNDSKSLDNADLTLTPAVDRPIALDESDAASGNESSSIGTWQLGMVAAVESLSDFSSSEGGFAFSNIPITASLLFLNV